MTQRQAVSVATILGMVVLVLLLVVCHPFSWGSELEVAVTGTSVSEAAVSGSGVSGTAVSGGAVLSGSAKGFYSSSVTGGAVTGSAIAIGSGNTLVTRIAMPDGYVRTEDTQDSLAYFLRNYPLRKDKSKVKLYDGSYKVNQDAHVAIFKLPLEKENLQQCADSIIRVYAEYYYKTGQYDKIVFRFVDGFEADYSKWRAGARIEVGANGAQWTDGTAADESYAAFKKYLRMVFSYANTTSLKSEFTATDISRMQIGDIFLQDGSSGHVVMVADLCENAEGKKAFLLAQGSTPAQQFHVLKNPAHEDDPWYYEEELTYPLKTPEFTFQEGSLMHRNDG